MRVPRPVGVIGAVNVTGAARVGVSTGMGSECACIVGVAGPTPGFDERGSVAACGTTVADDPPWKRSATVRARDVLLTPLAGISLGVTGSDTTDRSICRYDEDGK